MGAKNESKWKACLKLGADRINYFKIQLKTSWTLKNEMRITLKRGEFQTVKRNKIFEKKCDFWTEKNDLLSQKKFFESKTTFKLKIFHVKYLGK